MENKVKKYIWIAFCAGIVIYRLVFELLAGKFHTGALSAMNTAYILTFITAIVNELNLNKIIFYIMLGLSLLAFIYTLFFTKLW